MEESAFADNGDDDGDGFKCLYLLLWWSVRPDDDAEEDSASTRAPPLPPPPPPPLVVLGELIIVRLTDASGCFPLGADDQVRRRFR